MTERNVKWGLFSVFALGLGLLLTGAVLWLGVIAQDVLYTAALWFFILPIIMLIPLTLFGGAGISRKPIHGIIGSALVLLALMMLDALILQTMVPNSLLDASAAGVEGMMGLLLVGILFAIYEETFFTTIAGYMKLGGAPDLLVIGISMIVFVFLHALRYPDTLFYTLFLSISRAMLTAAMLKVDNSDVNFIAHIAFNILTVVF